ncbi:hypothetical protein C8J57DRAFT_1254125 [Mycena rebaudengoi]|nr:hypothetical protein C8J57DRAFT_1254125 [Mycena rebaudengoi]
MCNPCFPVTYVPSNSTRESRIGNRRVEYILPAAARQAGVAHLVIESSCNGMFGIGGARFFFEGILVETCVFSGARFVDDATRSWCVGSQYGDAGVGSGVRRGVLRIMREGGCLWIFHLPSLHAQHFISIIFYAISTLRCSGLRPLRPVWGFFIIRRSDLGILIFFLSHGLNSALRAEPS